MISLPNGTLKPLSEFATVNITSGSKVNREDLQTLGIVTARLDNGDLGGTIKEIKTNRSKIKLPKGIQYRLWRGICRTAEIIQKNSSLYWEFPVC